MSLSTPTLPARDQWWADQLRRNARTDAQHLQWAASGPVDAVAHMIINVSWRHLQRPNGTTYPTIQTAISDITGLSQAQAYMITNAACHLYIPLMDIITGEGWRTQTAPYVQIDVRPRDFRRLGVKGSYEVVARVRVRLAADGRPACAAGLPRQVIEDVAAEYARHCRPTALTGRKAL